MHEETKKQGFKPENQYDLYVASVDAGHHEVISHMVGSESVTIRSNQPSWGSVPIVGKEELKVLRDAMIKICEMVGIE